MCYPVLGVQWHQSSDSHFNLILGLPYTITINIPWVTLKSVLLTGEGAADVDQLPDRVAGRGRPLRGPLRHAMGNLLAGEISC